jgi:putative ABC transport system substrate-binding protein
VLSVAGTSLTTASWAVVLGLVMSGNAAAADAQQPSQVLVVRSSRLPAFDEALEGLRGILTSPEFAITVLDLDQAAGSGNLPALLARRPAVVVAAGSASVEAVTAAEHSSPIVATMVLAPAPGTSSRKKAVATITLDVPPAEVLRRLKQLYPNRNRIALIRGPALAAAGAARLEAIARSQGYRVQIFVCPGPKDLLDALGSLGGGFDFVWMLPDSRLYQGPTVSAAILAAIRYRVPLIGFSEGLVRAGALVGFYPDYRDIGRQTGEAVIRQIQGLPPVPVEDPRNVRAAVNERVMRVLGVEHAPDRAEGLVVVK